MNHDCFSTDPVHLSAPQQASSAEQSWSFGTVAACVQQLLCQLLHELNAGVLTATDFASELDGCCVHFHAIHQLGPDDSETDLRR